MENYFEPKDLPKVSSVHFKSLDATRVVIFVLGGFLSLGLLWILSFWIDSIVDFMYRKEENLINAEFVMFEKKSGKIEYVRLRKERCRILPNKEDRYYIFFFFVGQIFYFSNKTMKFKIAKKRYLQAIKRGKYTLQDLTAGLEKSQIHSLRKFYGHNKIKLKARGIARYFIDQIFVPANFFQLCISLGFFFLGRRFYSLMVLCYVLALITFKTYEYHVVVTKFKAISKGSEEFTVIRRREGERVEAKRTLSSNLCIGDIMLVEPNRKFPCDLLLVEGSCLTNESMLTGETTPVSKQAIEGKTLKGADAKHLLFSGTYSIFNRSKKVKGLVIGTGWNTTKGEMLNTIAFNDDTMLKFERDFFVLLAILFSINLFLIFTLLGHEFYFGTFNWKKDGSKMLQFLKSGFPPSLYFIAIASMQMSAVKLKAKQIGVLQMEKIVEGGGVTSVGFDKTGTLTESSLNMFGFVFSENGRFEACQNDLRNLVFYSGFREFLEVISCCHALVSFEDKLFGDPLDEVMFRASGSRMKIEEHAEQEFTTRIALAKEYRQMFKYQGEFGMRIVKTHDFSSGRKKMSTIVHNEELDELTLMVKGAPEALKEVCEPSSLPPDFDDAVIKFSEEGYRAIALAYKKLKRAQFTIFQSRIVLDQPRASVIARGEAQVTEQVLKEAAELDPLEIERGLTFVGLLLFENPIKESTVETIAELKRNYVGSFIVTGDNVYTAINVAYASGIIGPKQDLLVGSVNPQTSKVQLQEFFASERVEISRKPKAGEIDWEFSAFSSQISYSKRNIITTNVIDAILHNCLSEKKKIALEAKCFDYLHKILKEDAGRLRTLMDNTVVYGRASPEQKELIIEAYKSLLARQNKCLAFVGDGSNDCRALKAASVGLSIGNDESSFAASFTSTRINIAPIVDLIIEGKACLANAVQNFKFLMTSNLMSCFGIYLLNFQRLNINQFDYIYSFVFSFPFAAFMTIGRTKKRLNCLRMQPTLLTAANLAPFLIHLVIIFVSLGYMVLLLSTFPIRKTVQEVVGPYDPTVFDVDNHFFVENKLVFFFMCMMNIVNSMACYAGFPFKVHFLKNTWIVLYSLLTIAFVFFNIFVEKILDGYLLTVYIQQGRNPIYQSQQMKKFFAVALFVFTVVILVNTVIERIQYYKQLREIKGLKASDQPADQIEEEVIKGIKIE